MQKKNKIDNPVCAHCGSSLLAEQAATNFCSKCNASYCNEHFHWSEWSYIHLVTETMMRVGTCPKGHEKQELDS